MNEFVREFNAEIERNRTAASVRLASRDRKLADLDRKISSILKAIEDGMYHPTLKEKMAQLEAERAALVTDTSPGPAAVDVLIDPNLPELYRRKVSELERLLDTGEERAEAMKLIRSMIERVVLTPLVQEHGLDATLYGELGGDPRDVCGRHPEQASCGGKGESTVGGCGDRI